MSRRVVLTVEVGMRGGLRDEVTDEELLEAVLYELGWVAGGTIHVGIGKHLVMGLTTGRVEPGGAEVEP